MNALLLLLQLRRFNIRRLPALLRPLELLYCLIHLITLARRIRLFLQAFSMRNNQWTLIFLELTHVAETLEN